MDCDLDHSASPVALKEQSSMNGIGRNCNWRLCNVALGVALALMGRPACLAHDEQMSARELVDRAMQAQAAAQSDTSRFEYLQNQLEKRDTRTYRVVESDAGGLQRMVAINGQDPTPKQREREEQWLKKLLADPSIQKDRQKEDAEEEARRQKIITVLGKAFLYEIEGTEDGGQVARLHFRPNPQFHADSREAKVCAGLEGTMWIDQVKQRFTRAEGNLIRGVDFGWGLFGHLDKGGHFAIEQTEVDPGVWRITDLGINFKGSMLIFKSLNIRVHEHSFKFHRVRDHLSFQDALEMLRRDGSLQSTETTMP